MGIGRNDRVAIVLPNGPEMAAAFVAIAAGATTAPLNPAYKADEFDFYLTDLNAKALVIQQGMDSPARAVAAARGIPVVELVPDADGPAGDFTLQRRRGARRHARRRPARRRRRTSRWCCTPRAPRRGRRSCRCARPTSPPPPTTSARTLRADAGRSLPQHHAAVPHPRADRGRAVLARRRRRRCAARRASTRSASSPGSSEAQPTWYTAVPTMHQAILGRRRATGRSIARGRLRFIRSSSASLPPQVMAELEETFGVPVIEAYGMTEAAHQMATNPLPPRPRNPARSASPPGRRSRSWTTTARSCRRARLGEVVIRGRNVTAGYENNPDANATAFTNGWFRTGDQGVLDDRRLSAPHRPAQGDHQPRRREDLAARGRRGADGPPGRRAGASPSPCRTTSSARRSPPRSCCARAQAATERELRDFAAHAARRTSRCRARSCSSTRSPRAPPASCSASAWPRSSACSAMKIAIFGAGAIGGFLGAKLAAAGRGGDASSPAARIWRRCRRTACTLISGGETITVRPRCVADRRRGRARRTT